MAISPPSDIILDVASAADPIQVRAATARLAKLAADPTATNAEFGKALATARADFRTFSSSPVQIPSSTPISGNPTITTALPKDKSVYQKFEAVFLQNFVENILPKDDDLFGDKNSSGPYRSMMAEQIANQMAKAGGVGIAKAIEASQHGSTKHHVAQSSSISMPNKNS